MRDDGERARLEDIGELIGAYALNECHIESLEVLKDG